MTRDPGSGTARTSPPLAARTIPTEGTLNRTRTIAACTVAGVLLLTGCTTSFDTPPAGVPEPTVSSSWGDAREHLVVRTADADLRVEAVDPGTRDQPFPDDMPTVEADEVYVYVPKTGGGLTAAQYDPASTCEDAREAIPPTVTDLGDGWWKVRAAGHPGEYALELAAEHSGKARSAFVNLVTENPDAIPTEAWLTVVPELGGGAAGYADLTITTYTPYTTFDATFTVTGMEETTIALARDTAAGCVDRVLRFATTLTRWQTDAITEAAAAGGTFTVTVTRDGKELTATGNLGNPVDTALTFDPEI